MSGDTLLDRLGKAAAGKGAKGPACTGQIGWTGSDIEMIHLSCRALPLSLDTSGSALEKYLDYHLASQ